MTLNLCIPVAEYITLIQALDMAKARLARQNDRLFQIIQVVKGIIEELEKAMGTNKTREGESNGNTTSTS